MLLRQFTRIRKLSGRGEFGTKNLTNASDFIRRIKKSTRTCGRERREKSLTERGVFLTKNVETGRLERDVVGGYNVSVRRQM